MSSPLRYTRGTGNGKTQVGFFLHALAASVLERGKPNGLFVVRVSPVIADEHPVDVIDALKKYAFDRGYKRVLILGEHCVGVFVVYDVAYERQHVRPIGR